MWIDSTEEKVWERIIDFHEWKIWSPWAILEPSSKVDVSEDGKFYKWVGKHIGEGSMKIVNIETNKRVEIDLNLLNLGNRMQKSFFTFAQKIMDAKWSGRCKVPCLFFSFL